MWNRCFVIVSPFIAASRAHAAVGPVVLSLAHKAQNRGKSAQGRKNIFANREHPAASGSASLWEAITRDSWQITELRLKTKNAIVGVCLLREEVVPKEYMPAGGD